MIRGGRSNSDGALYERQAELDALEWHLNSAVSGSGALVLIEGAAGIGKSALLAVAAERAQGQGMRTLAARAGELERDLGFAVARRLFSAELARRNEVELNSLFDGAATLARSIFGLAGGDDGGGGVEDALARSLHGLQWLVANLAEEHPLVVLVDDAHWADDPSLMFLSYLADALPDLPVLALVAARTGEPGSRAEGVLAGLRESAAARLSPSALSHDGASALLRQAFPQAADSFVEACHESTGGNPFFLEEIVRAVAERGISPDRDDPGQIREISTEAMRRAVVDRIERAGEGPRALAAAVAIFPVGAEVRQVSALAGLDPEAAAAVADELARAGVLGAARPLEFLHPVMRTAVYDAIPEATRAARHRRAAELLIDEGAPADQIVFQLLRAEPAGDERSVAVLRAAAGAALGSGAYGGALAYAERALREPPPPELRSELMRELGTAEGHLGLADAFDHLRQAANGAPTPRLRAEILRELALALWTTGRFVEIGQVLTEAIDGLGPGDRDLAREIDADLVAAAQMQMLPLETIDARLARHDRGALTGSTLGERALLAVFAFDAVRKAEPVAQAAELARKALPGAMAPGGILSSMPLFLGLLALQYCEAFDLSGRLFERELGHARETGSRRGIGVFACFRGWSMWLCGRLDEALADATLSLETPGIQSLGILPVVAAVLAEVHLDRGELEQARAALAQVGISDQPAEEVIFDWPLCVRGKVATAEGALDDAMHDLTVSGARLVGGGAVNPAQAEWRSAAAEVAIRQGDANRALSLVEEELELARRFGAPRTLSVALRARARVASEGERLELLEEAREVMRFSPAVLERARVLTDFGAALRRANKRKDAREPLAEALEIAARAGARPLADRAKEELLATGARPRSELRSGVDALTPSERRVARLAADGHTNREIAEGLFVTKKTVEGHLRNVYAKLEIDSRDGLGEALRAG